MFVSKFTKIVKQNICCDKDTTREYKSFFKQTLTENADKMTEDQILVRYEKVVGGRVQQKNTLVDIDSINEFIALNNTCAIHEVRQGGNMRFVIDLDDCPDNDFIINVQDILQAIILKYQVGMPVIKVLQNSSSSKLAYHIYTNIWTSL